MTSLIQSNGSGGAQGTVAIASIQNDRLIAFRPIPAGHRGVVLCAWRSWASTVPFGHSVTIVPGGVSDS